MTVSITKEFTAQSFEFRCEVIRPVVLNEHKGSALRGALFSSLRKAGCSRLELNSCHPCTLVQHCPISFLLATVDEEGRRGGDVPRPFVVRPPLQKKGIFEVGEPFNFGLTLFARSTNFLPYLIIALEGLEREGLGARYEIRPGSWGLGAIRVREIVAQNPLSGQEQMLFGPGRRYVDVPEIPLTQSQVLEFVGNNSGSINKLYFNFHTPTRLVAGGKPLEHPNFPVLVQRLIERVSSISNEYGGAELALDFDQLMEEARAVLPVEDRTRWEQVRSYSRRQRQDLSLAGFVGHASFVGRVANLLPLLIWGQVTHVGKDATKGNGWYSLKIEEVAES
jgi:hypothetical protein